jgi:hypothetical protein
MRMVMVPIQQTARVVAVLFVVVLGLLPRLGNASSCILPVPGPKTGVGNYSSYNVLGLPGGDALIEAEEGWFQAWGGRLFESLFGPGRPGRDAYLTAAGSPPYEFWLSSTDPRFLGLPFELMREPGKPEPLALTIAGINRTLPGPTAPLELQHSESLRVLMVIARPLGEKDAAYRSVARPLFEKVQAVAGKVAIDLVRPPTFTELEQRLRAAKAAGRSYDILHFDGYGTFGTGGRASPHMFKQAEAKGFLLFEGDKEQDRLIAAADFGALMDEAGVPLVVFNACRSGQLAGGIRPEATVATRLMQGGTAAVVAMSFAVYVRAAAEFMAAFYEALFEGETVARAIQRGRLQLRRANLRPSPRGDMPLQDWCVPVHYSRREVAFSTLRREPKQRSGLSLEESLDCLRAEERKHAADAHTSSRPRVGTSLAAIANSTASNRH